MVAEAEISLSDALRQSWDAALFIGGGGAQVLFDDLDAQQLARSTSSIGGVVGAICIAPSVLARAGHLRGKRATAFASQRDDLVLHGALWDDGPVVVDGRTVTANGPDAAEQFGAEVADLLGI
jgi:protease I